MAPAGTTFLSSLFRLTQDTNPAGWSLTGTLSADRRSLSIDLANFRLGARGWGEVSVPLQSASDNGRSGVVADGRITVSGGTALPVASSAAIAYDAVFVAPKAITLEAPALGAEVEPGAPGFMGSGQPGATVTVRGTFGTLLGSGVVDGAGKWAIESTVSLAAGSYSGTVVQTSNGVVSSAPFSFTAVRNTAVTLTSPGIDAVVAAGRPVFSGAGKPGSTVVVRGQFGTTLGSATVDARGVWAVTSTVALVPGSYSGTATQDADGKVTTAPFKFIIK